jgi:hypothetical protein
MQNIQLRNVLEYLERYTNVDTLLFTGGNSKNRPEYFFRKYLKKNKVAFKIVSNVIPRIHAFVHPKTGVDIKIVSLTATSGAANRAVGSLDSYKQMKTKNPEFNA